MGIPNRFAGYLAAVVAASLFYVVWELVALPVEAGAHFLVQAAPFVWAFAAGLGLFLMLPPWAVAIWVARRLHIGGPVYFALIAAVAALILGGATSSLAPKPMFIENQTFVEGFVIAAKRQGINLLFTGFIGGLVYWFVGERRRMSSP